MAKNENEPKDEVVEEVKVEEKVEEKAKPKKAKKNEDEVEFLPVHGSVRTPIKGIFVENVETLFSVFETEDGKRYSVPYNHELYAALEAGDEVTF